jgi:hypothetical protein
MPSRLKGGLPGQAPACRRLVYHAGALGDFITALPAIRSWRGGTIARGGDETALLGRPAHAALAHPPFAAAWDAGSAPFAPLFSSGAGDEAGWLRRLLAEVRTALLFSPATSPLADNLRALGVTEILRQDPFPAVRVSVVDYHLALVGGAGDSIPVVATARGDPPFAVDAETVAVAPGSGSVAKNWPLERFEAIAARLKRRGWKVVWVLGPAEESVALPKERVVWRNVSLPVLAAAFSRCGLYVGNDSGVSHLAAAAGCATVALFGASDPVVWAPRGRTVRVVTSPGNSMNDLGVEDVWAACRDVLG